VHVFLAFAAARAKQTVAQVMFFRLRQISRTEWSNVC
jgi:hypothetical protein